MVRVIVMTFKMSSHLALNMISVQDLRLKITDPDLAFTDEFIFEKRF